MGVFFNRNSTVTGKTSTQEQLEIFDQLRYTGRDGRNYNLTSRDILNNSSIYTAVSMISGHLASMDFIHKVDGKEINSDLSNVLNVEPEINKSSYKFWKHVYSNIFYTGESFILINRDDRGRIIGFNFINTSDVEVNLSKRGTSIESYSVYFKEIDETKVIMPEHMLHLYFASEDGLRGYSIINHLKINIANQKGAEEYLRSYLEDGYHARNVLYMKGVVDATGEKFKNARNMFLDMMKGDSKAPLMLDERFDLKQLEINSDILKIITSSNHDTLTVARVFRIPKDKLSLDSPNASTVATSREYQQTTLVPYAKEIEAEITLKLMDKSSLGNSRIYLDVSIFNPIDEELEYNKQLNAYKSGAISMNEFRKKLGYEEINNEMGNSHYKNNQDGVILKDGGIKINDTGD